MTDDLLLSSLLSECVWVREIGGEGGRERERERERDKERDK